MTAEALVHIQKCSAIPPFHGVMEDARKFGERNWRNAARNRDSWQKLLKKALAQKGLLCR